MKFDQSVAYLTRGSINAAAVQVLSVRKVKILLSVDGPEILLSAAYLTRGAEVFGAGVRKSLKSVLKFGCTGAQG